MQTQTKPSILYDIFISIPYGNPYLIFTKQFASLDEALEYCKILSFCDDVKYYPALTPLTA